MTPLVYDQLRALAGKFLAGDGPVTLQPTVLVHEAYLRLFGKGSIDLKDRAYFFAAAGHAMRRILVDHARARDLHQEALDLRTEALGAEHLTVGWSLRSLANAYRGLGEPARGFQVFDLHDTH